MNITIRIEEKLRVDKITTKIKMRMIRIEKLKPISLLFNLDDCNRENNNGQSRGNNINQNDGMSDQGGNTKRLDSADLSDYHHSTCKSYLHGNFAHSQVHLKNMLILLIGWLKNEEEISQCTYLFKYF